MRRHVCAEVRVANDLLVDLHLFGQPQVVRHLDDDDAVEDRFVGVVGAELLPLGLVRVRDDRDVDVDHAVAAGGRDHLLLRGGDHRVQVLGLVLEDLDELDDAAIADVERAVQVEHARIAFGVDVELGDVLRADQYGGVLVVGIDRRDDADADAVALRERLGDHRHFLVAAAELLLQPVAAHRAEIALDVHADHLLELFAQMTGDQMQRLLEHRAIVDRVEQIRRFEAALQPLDERALARADRAHQVQNLTALLSLQRGGMEVTDDLRDRLLDAKELFLEEVVDLDRLVFVELLGGAVSGIVDVGDARALDDVVNAGVREPGKGGFFLEDFEVLDQGAAPDLALASDAILLDDALEGVDRLIHQRPPWGRARGWRSSGSPRQCI